MYACMYVHRCVQLPLQCLMPCLQHSDTAHCIHHSNRGVREWGSKHLVPPSPERHPWYSPKHTQDNTKQNSMTPIVGQFFFILQSKYNIQLNALFVEVNREYLVRYQ